MLISWISMDFQISWICNCQALNELPKFQSINKLNVTSPEILELAKNCTQSIFINHVRESIYLYISFRTLILWMGAGTRV